MEKSKKGGKREGSGRPKGIETTTIRIPLFLKPIIQKWIKQILLKEKTK